MRGPRRAQAPRGAPPPRVGPHPSALCCRAYRPTVRETVTEPCRLRNSFSTTVLGRHARPPRPCSSGRAGPARLRRKGTRACDLARRRSRRLRARRLRERGAAGEPLEPVRREVERRGAVEDLLGDRAGDCGRLHESVAGEAARGVDAVADPAEDRVRVGRHVVEARPTHRRSWRLPRAGSGARAARADRRTPTRRPSARSPSAARRRASRARAGRRGGGSGSRSRPRPPSAASPGRADGLGREQLPAERSDRQLDPELRPELGRPRPACDHERVGAWSSRLSRERALADLDAELDRAPDELLRHGRRIGDAVLGAEDARRARRPSASPATNDGSTRSTGHAQPGLQLAPLLELGEALLGRREEEVADLVEERRPELDEEGDALAARAAPRPRSRTAAGRRPSRATSSRRRSCRGRTARRRGRRAAPGGRRSPLRSRRRRRPGSRQLERRQLVVGQRAKRRADVARRSGRRDVPARPSRPPGTGSRRASARSRSASRGSLLRPLADECRDHLREDGGEPGDRARRRRRRARARRATRRRRRRRARRAGTARPSPRACPIP